MRHDPFDLVIYHHPCYDGFTSAWVAHLMSPEAEFVGAQHGDEPPDVQGKRVLIVDFSYPLDVLELMCARASAVVILDHHKTAMKDLEPLSELTEKRPEVVFDMGRSGAGLAWDELIGGERPELINYVEDRDLWRFKFPQTRAFHAGLTTLEWSFEAWDEARSNPERVVEMGEVMLRGMDKIARSLADRAGRVVLGEWEFWAVNVTPEFVSEVAEVLKNREPHLPILGWSWDGERNNFYCSVRSRDDGPDVSRVAKHFGGGGHQHAAGFRLDVCPVVGSKG